MTAAHQPADDRDRGAAGDRSGKVSLPPVLAGCHLALHQIARGLLRKRFDEDDEDGDEDQMLPFPGLQQRYPSFKQGASDREYVLLEKMSPADIAFNVARLRKEGATKSKHADALEAWWEIKQAAAGSAGGVRSR